LEKALSFVYTGISENAKDIANGIAEGLKALEQLIETTQGNYSWLRSRFLGTQCSSVIKQEKINEILKDPGFAPQPGRNYCPSQVCQFHVFWSINIRQKDIWLSQCFINATMV
jgi:hypothetical protein